MFPLPNTHAASDDTLRNYLLRLQTDRLAIELQLGDPQRKANSTPEEYQTWRYGALRKLTITKEVQQQVNAELRTRERHSTSFMLLERTWHALRDDAPYAELRRAIWAFIRDSYGVWLKDPRSPE